MANAAGNGGADALDRPRGDQQETGRRQACHQRRQAENGDPADEKQSMAAEGVAEPARQGDEAGEGQQIGVHHPVRADLGHRQIALDRRQRDADDGLVENDESEDAAHCSENPISAPPVVSHRDVQPSRSGGIDETRPSPRRWQKPAKWGQMGACRRLMRSARFVSMPGQRSSTAERSLLPWASARSHCSACWSSGLGRQSARKR